MDYYNKMLLKERLIPIRIEDKLIGLITYYIGDNTDRFVRNNPFDVLEDDENGRGVYIDQLIVDGNVNQKKAFRALRMLKLILQEKHPNAEYIRWNRHKKGVSNIYYRRIDAL